MGDDAIFSFVAKFHDQNLGSPADNRLMIHIRYDVILECMYHSIDNLIIPIISFTSVRLYDLVLTPYTRVTV